MLFLTDYDTISELERLPYRCYCLGLADICDSIMFIHVRRDSSDKFIQECIGAIREHHKGKMSLKYLHYLGSKLQFLRSKLSIADGAVSETVEYAIFGRIRRVVATSVVAYAYTGEYRGVDAASRQEALNMRLLRESRVEKKSFWRSLFFSCFFIA